MTLLRLLPIAATAAALTLATAGCGAVAKRQATEQLILSDAVDRAVAEIDFSPLAGERVFLDTAYMPPDSASGPVKVGYVASALRQQLAAHGCLLAEKAEEADVIVESRIGALGSDQNEVTFGIPANNLASAAAGLATGAQIVPTMPEIALARRQKEYGAAKLYVFAYDRVRRQAIWQSGLAEGRSTARDTWILGGGPYQEGTIDRRGPTLVAKDRDEPRSDRERYADLFFRPTRYRDLRTAHEPDDVRPAALWEDASGGGD